MGCGSSKDDGQSGAADSQRRSRVVKAPPTNQQELTSQTIPSRATTGPQANNSVSSTPHFAFREHPDAPLSTTGTISVSCCRFCSDHFEYVSRDSRHVNIIVGDPGSQKYKALSYVWGKTNKVPINCTGCGRHFTIPMQDATKLDRLTMFASDNEYLWIDALSINQDDPADKRRLIGIMGQIYANASSVAILLPPSDKRAAEILPGLGLSASVIIQHQLEISRNDTFTEEPRLTRAVQAFYKLINELETDLQKYTYWCRAWTFQEWALAADISMGWEGTDKYRFVDGIKSSVLHAATLLAVYKFQQKNYAKLDLGFNTADVVRRFNSVKRLFPSERAFFAPDEIPDDSDTDNQFLFGSLAFGKVLGVRTAQSFTLQTYDFENRPPIYELFRLDLPSPYPPDSTEFLQTRLSTMLNTLGTSKRQAGFEADRVSSWASMCNIKYDYQELDTFAVALAKVVDALRRQRNISIYNFLANATGGVDLEFTTYATAHAQCNGANQDDFRGTPIFTGRADTAVHVQAAIMQPNALTRLDWEGAAAGVALQRVQRSKVLDTMRLDDKESTLKRFQLSLMGEPFMFFTDVMKNVQDVLEQIPVQLLAGKMLVRAQCGFSLSREMEIQTGLRGVEHQFTTWAICPFEENAVQDYIVARESINGQLVLARPSADGTHGLDIIGYLALTDQVTGTHLVRMDDGGKVEIVLKEPKSRSWGHSGIDERIVRVDLKLDATVLVAN